ncbi:hypothetical protein CSIM01_07030 [Colletotrichum simmondsii]|uniref:Uncharacterized protein n=1 Tax=Colletotrichum simmondsii TaxID=703756 RepID=A0A135RT48_9PEZI|nr:hypothetical protein CSIM01_07030 [Colletotrichum simmondsii]
MERYCQSTPTQQQQAAKQGPIEEANESLTATFKLDVRNPFARPPLQAMSTTPNLVADARPGALRRLRESFARGFAMGATKPTAPPRVESGCSDELYLAFLLHFQFGLMPDPKAWRTVNPSPH